MTKYDRNPFLFSLRQPPRSMKNHGKHRRTSPQAHSSPIDRADSGAGGTNKGTITFAQYATQLNTINYATSNSGVGAGAVDVAAMVEYMRRMVEVQIYGSTIETPKLPPIPHVGIKVGEIIGYRYWYIRTGGLGSIAHDFIWEPGKTIVGDLSEAVFINYYYKNKSIFGGVYAFSEPADAMAEAMSEVVTNIWPKEIVLVCGGQSITVFGLAIGTISLWGEVVEHERGYRGQFAKVRSIDSVIGEGDINALREKYGV